MPFKRPLNYIFAVAEKRPEAAVSAQNFHLICVRINLPWAFWKQFYVFQHENSHEKEFWMNSISFVIFFATKSYFFGGEKLKAKHASKIFWASHQTQLSMPAAGVLKRNSLIHIWCTWLSFSQTLANLSSQPLFTACRLRMKQYKFSRQMHSKNKPQVNVRSSVFCVLNISTRFSFSGEWTRRDIRSRSKFKSHLLFAVCSRRG